MQEALLQYIWKNSLFQQDRCITDTGEVVTILDTGMHNSDGGPDFTNARIEINGTIWAGNVEVHVNASDWYAHKHHTDRAYNNVILHAVARTDKECLNAAGRQVPCLNLQYDKRIERKYRKLITNPTSIHCCNDLHKLDRTLISFWLSALAIERLQSKTSAVKELLSSTKNNWEEAFYIYTAHSFGLKINTLPFELIAKSISIKILSLHSNNLAQLEALFFGQAGFLEGDASDEYQESLKKEYNYLKAKYRLKPIENHLWKFLRLRPTNFPTIRIAQFCSLIYRSKHLFSRTIECYTPEQLISLYHCGVSEYWKNHYTFGNPSKSTEKVIGKETINTLIINTIIPFMFIYGGQKNDAALCEKAVRLLELLPSEINRLTRTWTEHGIHPRNAAESQALIQLSTGYCEIKRCIECQIGHLVLRG